MNPSASPTTGTVQSRLQALGLTLPTLAVPTANYRPFRRHGDLVYLAGQTSSQASGESFYGTLANAGDVPRGYQAARLCMLNLLAALSQCCDGDLERVGGCLKVNGYVLADRAFDAVPAVVNGASDLLVELLGDAGQHARTAIGVSVLPRSCSVEVEAVFFLKS
ncbi:MAG: RidA family protein [Haliea sp.]|nr:MAG: RidA family protein [Haliea sp.]